MQIDSPPAKFREPNIAARNKSMQRVVHDSQKIRVLAGLKLPVANQSIANLRWRERDSSDAENLSDRITKPERTLPFNASNRFVGSRSARLLDDGIKTVHRPLQIRQAFVNLLALPDKLRGFTLQFDKRFLVLRDFAHRPAFYPIMGKSVN